MHGTPHRTDSGANHDLGPDERGRFVRRATQFRERVEVAAGRYKLIVSNACPWCHRTTMVRILQGHVDDVELEVVEPLMKDDGWVFADGRKLHALYTQTQPDYTGRVSVPVLWDKENDVIVNNESSDIIQMFDSDFSGDVQAMIDANYNTVNNGVYRAGFAGSQAAYDEAVSELFARLDALDAILDDQRYLCGDTLTLADICLFPTLYRFDAVYNTHFKCNIRALRDYDNLWPYTRDIYQHQDVRESCELDEIKQHYYRSHESVNPRGLVPLGPDIDWDEPHGRG